MFSSQGNKKFNKTYTKRKEKQLNIVDNLEFVETSYTAHNPSTKPTQLKESADVHKSFPLK